MASVVSGNRIPLYHQVAQSLKQRVRTGAYQPGELLPSFRALCDEFGVSLKVVQWAVSHLEKEGVLITHHGKGMRVVDAAPCDQAAILFGLIEPFETYMGFESQILRHAERIFASRNDFMVTRSSEGDPAQERIVAEHFAENGIKGILLWPVDNDPNGEFFEDLAKRIPVVLVDRRLKGAELPIVMTDCCDLGQQVCRHMLQTTGHRRLLVLMDDLKISSYDDFICGIEEVASTLGRAADVTIQKLPVSQLVRQLNQADFSQVGVWRDMIEGKLRDGGYDAVFCLQDEIIDLVLVETGLHDRFKNVQLGATRSPGVNTRSLRYNLTAVLEWVMDHPRVMQTAANMLQQWVYARHATREVVSIRAELRKKPLGHRGILL